MTDNKNPNQFHGVQVKGPKDKDFRTIMTTGDARSALEGADKLGKKLGKGTEVRAIKQSKTTTMSEPEVLQARTKPQSGATRKVAATKAVAPKKAAPKKATPKKPAAKDGKITVRG